MHRPRRISLVRRWASGLLLLAAGGLVSGIATAQDLPSPWGSRPIDGGTWYEPAGLPAGTVFNVWAPRTLRVAEPATVTEAFLQARQAHGFHGVDMAGRSARCDAVETTPGGVTQACRLEDGQGGPALDARFVMLPPSQGRLHFIRVLTGGDAATVARFRDGASAAMALETRRWAAEVDDQPPRGARASSARGLGSGRGPAPAGDPAASTEKDTRPAPQATAGRPLEIRSVPPAEIGQPAGHPSGRAEDAVLLFSPPLAHRGPHGAAASGTVYLLLADGTAYRGLAVPPDGVDVEVSKREETGRWVSWRRRGAFHEVRNPGSPAWNRLDKASLAWPAVEQERLGGRYVPVTGADGPGGSPSAAALVFHPDGRFEEVGGRPLAAGVFASPARSLSSSGQGANPPPGTLVTSTRPKDEALDSISGPVPARDDAVVSTSTHRPSPAGSAGHYRLGGWTLELRHGDGTVERRLFLFTDEAREVVRIGERVYRREGAAR